MGSQTMIQSPLKRTPPTKTLAKSLFIGLFLASTLLPLAVSGDVLVLDEVRQVEKMDLPRNGLSKADVESRFGTPRKRHNAVGDPPITRWDYETYSVYFEYDLVLYSVLAEGQVVDKA
jgi:hypothetical protein